jgi:nucleotide-binding universal stress UspA family protein
MTYKTIVLHCNDKRRIGQLLVPAVQLAEAFQAHLIGLSIVPPVAVISAGAPEGMPMIVDDHCKLYREQNAAMRSEFQNATRGRAFVSEWRDDEADAFGVGDRALQYARAADLVIAGQSDPNWAATDMLDVADRLAMESGRPVVIVPQTEAREQIGERVLVAWNGRREAARAVFDALPILQRAKEVKVTWVNPQSEHDEAEDIPAADICATLARHGVMCEATDEVQPRTNVGETLLACAKDYGADLMVMGCYGHTRLREFVFGGASRHVLKKMSIPVLMSH